MSEMTSNLTLQYNVDGIPMYHKAKYNLWPIHCMINELPPSKRKENIMMCGLWFGSSKPVFKTYLKPFVEELKVLCEKGLSWKNNGKIFSSRVIPILCTADAPARAMLQNFNQYNGKFSCGFCENEGERIERGRGHSRVYKVSNPLPAKRTFGTSVEYAEIAVNMDKPVKGVKGSSLLMKLYPYFDMVEGFVPDYMHSVLLGVTRQFVNLRLSTSDEAYCLKKRDVSEVNDRINNLKEPSEVTRKLHSFGDVIHWKASEWRIFLLTSPVLLLNVLNPTTYNHWILLVHAITILLGTNIKSSDLQTAESAIQKFVTGVTEIYGEGELTYNVHLLLHLPDKVKSWGPLCASSCFAYEDALGKLKNFHQGTKGVPMQILFAYLKKNIASNISVRRH
nr:uncharacterized protein LOC107448063 [Parasteatoda tepidariorum]